MEIHEIIILLSVIFVLVLVALFFLPKLLKKEEKKISDDSLLEIKSLFGEDNIVGIEQVQKRVRVEVKDLKFVDLKGLQPLTNGVFTIGNKVVVTFKENTDEIVKILGEK